MIRIIAIAGITYLAVHDRLPFASQTTADAMAGLAIALLLLPWLRHFME